jgi:hypothetical protein
LFFWPFAGGMDYLKRKTIIDDCPPQLECSADGAIMDQLGERQPPLNCFINANHMLMKKWMRQNSSNLLSPISFLD